ALQRLHQQRVGARLYPRVVGEVDVHPAAVLLRPRRRRAEAEEVAVDVDRDPPPRLVVAADVLLHAPTRSPAVVADVRRGRVRLAVPASDPDLVGQPVGAGLVDPSLVQRPDARAGAGVDARHVVEGVDPARPAAQERERRPATARLPLVEALQGVAERAAAADPELLGRPQRATRLHLALLAGLAVGAARARVLADHRVRAVAREARVA